jgi:hypothetical protein
LSSRAMAPYGSPIPFTHGSSTIVVDTIVASFVVELACSQNHRS